MVKPAEDHERSAAAGRSTAARLLGYACFAMVLVLVIGFGVSAAAQPFRRDRYLRPEVIVHILLLAGWTALFIVEARLIARGNVARHRLNARLATILVLVSSIQAVYLTYRFGDVTRFLGESRDVLAFALLFALSVWAAMRGRLDWHMRLMLIGTLNLVGPAYVRLGQVFDWWTIPVTLLATLLTWVLPAIAFDLATRHRIHRATLASIGFNIASFAMMVAVVLSPLRDWVEAPWFS